MPRSSTWNLGDASGIAGLHRHRPYFDDLFLMARTGGTVGREGGANRRVGQIGSPQALLINRMMVDSVVEAPMGSLHSTAEPGLPSRREVPGHYAEAAAPTNRGGAFYATYLAGDEADYQPRCGILCGREEQ